MLNAGGFERDARIRGRDALRVLLDETDVTAALDVADTDIFQIFGSRIETEVFLNVVFGDVIAAHASQDQIAILDDLVRMTFDEDAESMRVISNKGEKPVDDDNDQASTERREKRGAAIDRARKNRCEDNN